MRLYYLPEFWFVVIASIGSALSTFLMIRKIRKKNLEFAQIIEKHYPMPNVSDFKITKNHLIICPSCSMEIILGVQDRENVKVKHTDRS